MAKDIVIECNSYNCHVHETNDCTGWTFLHRLAVKDNLIVIALMAILHVLIVIYGFISIRMIDIR